MPKFVLFSSINICNLQCNSHALNNEAKAKTYLFGESVFESKAAMDCTREVNFKINNFEIEFWKLEMGIRNNGKISIL